MYLNLKKAFDTVDIDILLSRLEMYGIRNNELGWFHNYLTGRSQVISVTGAISDSHDIDVGVPQGSVPGPLLFIVFINVLPNVVNKCKITLYADDTALFSSSKSVHEIQTVLILPSPRRRGTTAVIVRHKPQFLFLLHNWQIMPFGHITPVRMVVCRLMV